MMRKFYAFLILLSIAYSGSLFAQSGAGELRGKVQDVKTKEGIPFAAVIVESSGSQVAAQQTDFDGNFVIKPIPPGKYDVRVKIIGYNDRLISGVIITSNKQTYVNPDLSASVRNISEVTVTDYAKPLIEIDNTSAGGSLNAEEIVKLPTRNINSLVSTTAGVYQADEGAALSVKGSRTDANDYYIDGVKVRGTTNLPQGAIEQITVITGGVPAQYGDATGGIVTITSKGPSKVFYGGIEAATSEFLDGYGYNLVSGSLSGPILLKNKGTEAERSLVGFFASAELETRRDQTPSYVGAWKAKSDYQEYLKKNPGQYILLMDATDTNITGIKRVPTANFVSSSNIDKLKNQDDNENRVLSVNLRLDYQPNLNNTFALGMRGNTNRNRVYSRANMLFNSENNSVLTRNFISVFGRYTQKFNQATDESKATLKNAYYTIQADFSRDYSVQQDINHKDNFFNYGHIGNYKTSKADFIGAYDVNADQRADTLLGSDGKLYTQSNYRFRTSGGKIDTAYAFSANGSSNPNVAVYNENLLEFIDQQEADGDISVFGYRNFSGFNALTGILNGGGPQAVYGGLFNSPGTISNVYDVNNRDQYRVTAMASADFKGHAIQVGVEYEQRVESRFRLLPRGLWGQMRAQQNAYLRLDENGIDVTNGTIDVTKSNITLIDSTTFLLATQNYYNSTTTEFAKNIRTKLGKGAGEFIDIDSYDPSTFSLSMFDASNLIDNLNPSGLQYTYFGYTYDGKKSTENYSMEDFLSNPLTRPVGAFRPIYTAGYIQDKFTFKDIVFNLGVRVDRFDANQQVLKDKYSLYQTRTAGELSGRPSNIPADAAVYVDDNVANPTVRGYRFDDIFYDANGNVVQDYEEIKSLVFGRPTPWLVDEAIDTAGKAILTPGAFKDYEPQTQIMPRIAFSFPISDEASFFANYDVLTQRPRTNVYANPITYYLQSLGKQSQIIVSPDLKPEKTINYQFGFKQRLGQTSAITMTAFYKELKDNFQQVQIATAFPTSYLTYTNRDFGTIKGFTLQYDLRRTNNIQLNAAYTLQFASGTGSNSNSAQNLISSGESEPIRIALPLDYDQRHTIVTTIDYRYGSGASYTGPAALKSVLENFGINFIFRAGSGTPYSRIKQENVQDLLSAGDTRFRTLIGEINGSRLPWQYNMDLRLDKDFSLTSKNAEGKGRNTTINVYLLVQNIFDTRRVASVYPATGLPDDDGYLTSPQAGDYLNSIGNEGTVQSYIDLYKIAVNDPGNFRLPRVVRIGASYNF